jgi:hypothetical protein
MEFCGIIQHIENNARKNNRLPVEKERLPRRLRDYPQ